MASQRERARVSLPTKAKTARFSETQFTYSPPQRRRTTTSNLNTTSIPIHFHRPASRIDKTRDSDQRQSQVEVSNSKRVAALLDEYRERIRQDTENRLDERQNDLNDDVDDLATQFQDRVKLLHDAEAPILSTILDEKLRIPVEQKSPKKVKDLIVSLEDRVLDFESYVKEKEQTIAKLTGEWNDTQMSLLCLAAEILGPNAFDFGNGGLPPSMQKAVTRALEKNKASNQQHQGVLTNITNLEDRVKELTLQTKDTAAKQNKAMKISQKRQLNALTSGLKELLESA